MAGAMIGGLLNSHAVEAKAMTASDPHADRTQDLEKRFGVATTSDNLKAAKNADIVILSVKPQMLRFVFRDLCGKLRKDALVLSIIAGARVESMTQGLKHHVHRAVDAQYAGAGRRRDDGVDRQRAR